MPLSDRLWYLTRPLIWRWRLGYWDWDAIKAVLVRALTTEKRK